MNSPPSWRSDETARRGAPARLAVGGPQPVRQTGRTADYAVGDHTGVIAYGSVNRVARVHPSNAEVGHYVADFPLLVREEPSR